MHGMLVQHRTHTFGIMLLELLGTIGKQCLPLKNRCICGGYQYKNALNLFFGSFPSKYEFVDSLL